ncbi:hypothetical protein E4U59_006562, partial [Claviceps monticola]
MARDDGESYQDGKKDELSGKRRAARVQVGNASCRDAKQLLQMDIADRPGPWGLGLWYGKALSKTIAR